MLTTDKQWRQDGSRRLWKMVKRSVGILWIATNPVSYLGRALTVTVQCITVFDFCRMNGQRMAVVDCTILQSFSDVLSYFQTLLVNLGISTPNCPVFETVCCYV